MYFFIRLGGRRDEDQRFFLHPTQAKRKAYKVWKLILHVERNA